MDQLHKAKRRIEKIAKNKSKRVKFSSDPSTEMISVTISRMMHPKVHNEPHNLYIHLGAKMVMSFGKYYFAHYLSHYPISSAV